MRLTHILRKMVWQLLLQKGLSLVHCLREPCRTLQNIIWLRNFDMTRNKNRIRIFVFNRIEIVFSKDILILISMYISWNLRTRLAMFIKILPWKENNFIYKQEMLFVFKYLILKKVCCSFLAIKLEICWWPFIRYTQRLLVYIHQFATTL